MGGFWTTLCEIVGAKQLLLTAYHPQTDGGTERANQEVQAILRTVVAFHQYDWKYYLPAYQIVLNNRDSTVTGVSPNRLLNGYEMEPVPLTCAQTASTTSPKGRAVAFLDHLRQGQDLAQAAIAFEQ